MKTTASQGRFLAWLDVQGAKIKAARPKPVYYACARLAQDRARDGAVKLTAVDIERCRERALSNERARRFGRVPRDEAEWYSQVNAILADWQSQCQRHLASWMLQPVAELLAEEATEKLGAAVAVDLLTPLQAFDQGGSARAVATLVQAMAQAKEAGLDPAVVAGGVQADGLGELTYLCR